MWRESVRRNWKGSVSSSGCDLRRLVGTLTARATRSRWWPGVTPPHRPPWHPGRGAGTRATIPATWHPVCGWRVGRLLRPAPSTAPHWRLHPTTTPRGHQQRVPPRGAVTGLLLWPPPIPAHHATTRCCPTTSHLPRQPIGPVPPKRRRGHPGAPDGDVGTNHRRRVLCRDRP